MNHHPADETLRTYSLGKLDDASASAVGEHLKDCLECRRRAAETSPDTFLGRLREIHDPSAGTIPGGSVDAATVSVHQAKAPSPSPSAETLPPGLSNHHDYQIKRELGRGGMGVVYLAHNTMMGRDEVLKVIGRQIIERPGVLERFQREIRAVGQLRHPNIVTAHSAFRIEGGLVFAMEYVEGLDLARLVKTKGPLSVAHAAYFVHQAALGLQHAHEKGMVHRDIKPDNLMLTSEGKARVVKVLDFGLAKATRENKVDGGLTSEGQALGTPDFIAPEQILNAIDVDIRADIYSLGGTLFYLLTGRPPFRANSLYDIYQAHISRDAEPLNLIRPDVPAELAALVAKMMAKDRDRRFQTPGKVAEALTPFFKKTAAVSKSEFSTLGQPGPRRVEPSPTEPSSNKRDRAPKPKSTVATSQPEGLWEGLIDTTEAEQTDNLASPLARSFAPRRPERPPWVIPATLVGLALVSILIVGGIIITIKSKDGKVVISDPPPGTVLTVEPEKVSIKTGGDDGGKVPPVPPVAAKDEKTPLPREATEVPPVPPSAVKVEKSPPPREPSIDRVAVLAAALEKRIPMHFPRGVSLDDLIKHIKKATKGPDGLGIPIYVDPFGLQDAEKDMASIVTIDLEGVPLKKTLRLALNPLGLDYRAGEGLLFIGAIENFKEGGTKEGETLTWDVKSDRTSESKIALKALEKPIPMRYPGKTPIRVVVDDLKKSLKGPDGSAIPIHVDPNGLQEADKTMDSVATIDLKDLPLRISLHLMLHQLGMSYYVKDGLVIITDWGSIPKDL